MSDYAWISYPHFFNGAWALVEVLPSHAPGTQRVIVLASDTDDHLSSLIARATQYVYAGDSKHLQFTHAQWASLQVEWVERDELLQYLDAPITYPALDRAIKGET